MEIKTIIIEDETNARKALENMLTFYAPDVTILGHSDSVAEGVPLIESHNPDLLLLDVHLSDGTGFDLLKKLKKKNLKIVFVTAFDKYALPAIKLSAIDYLLKPVKPDELRKALSKVRNALEDEEQADLQIETVIENFNGNNQNKKIILNTNTNIYVIEIKDLVHCESVGNYTTVCIKEKKDIMISKTLKDFEEMLAPFGFFRIHQSHLINMDYVETYEKKGGGRVKLKTGEVLAVSSRKKDNFIKAIQAYSDII